MREFKNWEIRCFINDVVFYYGMKIIFSFSSMKKNILSYFRKDVSIRSSRKKQYASREIKHS